MATTGSPSEAYPFEALCLPLLRPTHLPLRLSIPKSVTRQPTGIQGMSRSIRGIGVPVCRLTGGNPPVSRQTGTVNVLGDHHAVLKTHFTTSALRNSEYLGVLCSFKIILFASAILRETHA